MTEQITIHVHSLSGDVDEFDIGTDTTVGDFFEQTEVSLFWADVPLPAGVVIALLFDIEGIDTHFEGFIGADKLLEPDTMTLVQEGRLLRFRHPKTGDLLFYDGVGFVRFDRSKLKVSTDFVQSDRGTLLTLNQQFLSHEDLAALVTLLYDERDKYHHVCERKEGKYLSHEACVTVAPAFAHMYWICEWSLMFNELSGQDVASALSFVLCHNRGLDRMFLNHNRLDCSDAAVLAEGLAANKWLVELNLVSNPIGDEGVNALVESVMNNGESNLRVLRLSREGVSHSVQSFAKELLHPVNGKFARFY